VDVDAKKNARKIAQENCCAEHSQSKYKNWLKKRNLKLTGIKGPIRKISKPAVIFRA
jgi:hypothetical protein